ncbi:MAG: DUF4906 domain-containing protein [Bacteroidia bacterium]|nr:DUF4906 domain-containing protein [Bacteroidia bacterium]
MKRGLSKYILFATAAALNIFSSCTVEKPELSEENKATVTVSIAGDSYKDAVTRSSFSWKEDEIYDAVLIVTDEDGNIEKVMDSGKMSSMTFEGIVGRTYSIWGTANTGDRIDIKSLSDLTGTPRTVSRSQIEGNGIPMFSVDSSGKPGPATITISGSNDRVVVHLVRMMARIDFKVDKSSLENPDGFVIERIRLFNAIGSYLPFSEKNSQKHDGYYDSVLDVASESDLIGANSGESVTLYAFENMQGDLLPDNDDPWKKVPSSIGNAEGCCSYIELSVSYVSGPLSCNDIKYRFYLGDDSTSNFDVKRNTRYSVTLYPSEKEIDGHRGSWKIESSGWNDDRSLAFNPKAVTIESLQRGCTDIVKSPSDIIYDFTYDPSEAEAAGVTISKSGDSISITSTKELTDTRTVTLHIETPDKIHQDNCVVTVTPKAHVPVISYKLVVTPDGETIDWSDTKQFKAVEYEYADGVRTSNAWDVTDYCDWSSSDVTVATVNSKGLVTSKNKNGRTVITAVYDKPSDGRPQASATLYVERSLYLTGIDLTMEPDWIHVGEKSYGTVIAHFSDGSSEDVTGYCSWSSNAPRGTFTGTVSGTFTVTARYGDMSNSDDVHVNDDISYGLVITPTNQAIDYGGTAYCTATYFTYTNGIRDGGVDVTEDALWIIVSGSSVSNDGGGRFSWGAEGASTVKATYNGYSDTASINCNAEPVVPKVLESIVVSDDELVLCYDNSWADTFTVTAYFSDGSSEDITLDASYSKSGPFEITPGTAAAINEGSGSISISYAYEGVTMYGSISVVCLTGIYWEGVNPEIENAHGNSNEWYFTLYADVFDHYSRRTETVLLIPGVDYSFSGSPGMIIENMGDCLDIFVSGAGQALSFSTTDPVSGATFDDTIVLQHY